MEGLKDPPLNTLPAQPIASLAASKLLVNNLSRTALRLPSSLLLCSPPPSLVFKSPPSARDSVLSVPIMSQHMDAYPHFQGNGPRLSKGPICLTRDKNQGIFMATQRVSSASSLWNIQYQSFGEYLAEE